MKTDFKKQRPPLQAATDLLLPRLVDEQNQLNDLIVPCGLDMPIQSTPPLLDIIIPLIIIIQSRGVQGSFKISYKSLRDKLLWQAKN